MSGKNLLIDTQSFIWFSENNPQLSISVRKIMEDKQNNLFISIASLWEIVIKSSLGKLELKRHITEIINDFNKSGFNILQIKPQHLLILYELEHIHKDPFDRIIISQAISEKMLVISSDLIFNEYPIEIIKE